MKKKRELELKLEEALKAIQDLIKDFKESFKEIEEEDEVLCDEFSCMNTALKGLNYCKRHKR